MYIIYLHALKYAILIMVFTHFYSYHSQIVWFTNQSTMPLKITIQNIVSVRSY